MLTKDAHGCENVASDVGDALAGLFTASTVSAALPAPPATDTLRPRRRSDIIWKKTAWNGFPFQAVFFPLELFDTIETRRQDRFNSRRRN